MNSKHLQHLYWRAGFGILPNKVRQYSKSTLAEVIEELFENSKRITPLKVDTSYFNNITGEEYKENRALRLKAIDKSNELRKEINYKWLERLTNPKEILRERMTLFWANHFVCENKNIIYVQHYNNTLRKHALGNFKSFVKAISREPAMLNYLNIKQNKKLKPNENFARELLELFTIGVGNYTEKDIQEAARAFTGYYHDFKGNFKIRGLHHDQGQKTFFNEVGNFRGDAIINIILDQPQCARFICEKIYRYFVNDKIVPSHINEMVNVFYPSYNIEPLMRHIFSAYWFYDSKNIGAKIKSPVDLLVGIQNIVPIQFLEKNELLKIQRILGQTLFSPPNVAGWEGGKGWIDSNTMIARLRLASILMNEFEIPINEKAGFIDKYRRQYFKNNSNKSIFKTKPNWKVFHENFDSFSPKTLEDTLVLSKINKGTKMYLNRLAKSSKQNYCIQLMSLPEYQMC